jgi:hypothetical protein
MVVASIPSDDGKYDLDALSEIVMELKREYPEQDSASVLMEAHIPYDYLIRVMDIVRNVELPVEGTENEYEMFALFSDISVGDAP